MLSAYWMPVGLLALHRYVQRRQLRWLALFGAAWLLQALCSGYYLLFYSVLVVGWLCWFVRGDWSTWIRIGATWSVWALPLVPLLLKFRAVHHASGFRRSLAEVEFFSADATGLLDGSSLLIFWQSPFAYHKQEGELFPGVTIALMVGIGLWRAYRTRAVAGRVRPRLRSMLKWTAIVAGLIALSAIVVNRWETRVLGIPFSVSGPERAVSVLLVACAGLVLTSPRFSALSAACRARSAWVFYIGATAAMWLLSFGPSPTVLGRSLWYAGPYAGLMLLPGFDESLRVPARFAMLAALCLAVAAALAFARMVPNGGRWRRLILVGISIGILMDGWVGGVPTSEVPVVANVLADHPRTRPLLELPAVGVAGDIAAMFRAMTHCAPVFNGYSGYRPPHYFALKQGLDERDPAILDALAAIGPFSVLVEEPTPAQGEWTDLLLGHPGARRVRKEGVWALYHVPGVERAPGPGGHRLPVVRVSATIGQDQVMALSDGDLATRWDTRGPQQGGEALSIDLGRLSRVDGITLSLGPHPQDYPRRLLIESSSDGRQWHPEWVGSTRGVVVTAGLKHPRTMLLTFAIGPTRARFIRLRQLATDPRSYWSVAELEVRGGDPVDR